MSREANREAGIIGDSAASAPAGEFSIDDDGHSSEQQQGRGMTEGDLLRRLSHQSSQHDENGMMEMIIDPHHEEKEVLTFPTDCPHCGAPAETNMSITDVPHFTEVVIMTLQCEGCGFKSNEIKGGCGGAIADYGTRITLRVKDDRDLKREVVKGDAAGISVPELAFEMEGGGLGGVFTTVEGLLLKMHDRLRDSHPFGSKDDPSMKQNGNNDDVYGKFMEFLARMRGMATGQRFPFTLILTDPLSNSFIGPLRATANNALSSRVEMEDANNLVSEKFDDGQLRIEEYERTEDQNESLGMIDD